MPHAAPARDAAPARAARILVVDDDAAIGRLLRVALRASGYDVVVAANGLEALEQLAQRPADAIVLDLEMPVMGGREFYRRLRERGVTAPVAIVSAHGAEHARRELGAEAAVAKPFEPADLIAAIDRLLAR